MHEAKGQTKLSQEQIIKGKLIGRYWTTNNRSTKDWGAIFYRSDSSSWRQSIHGLTFKFDKTFEESPKRRCGHDRKPYSGNWYVSNDTLYLNKATGEKIWAFKVLEVNKKKLIIKYVKP